MRRKAPLYLSEINQWLELLADDIVTKGGELHDDWKTRGAVSYVFGKKTQPDMKLLADEVRKAMTRT